jgi:hypothetical protein
VSLTTNTNRTKSDIYGSRDDISSSMESRRSESRVEEIFFFFFFGVDDSCTQASVNGKECQELGPRIFLTLPNVEFGKIDNNFFRGKTKFQCDLKVYFQNI